MANIQINFTDPSTGANSPNSYWTIASANLNTNTNLCDVVLSGYFSQTVKNNGLNPTNIARYTIPFASLGITNSMTIGQLQNAILNYATGATENTTGIVLLAGGTVN